MAIKDLVPRFNRGRERLPERRGAYDPFDDFRREMNRLFDDFFSDFPFGPRQGERGTGLMPRWLEKESAPALFSPRVDVAETDTEVKISAELPGLDEKDIAVEMGDDALTIRGERRAEKEDKGRNWHRREQSYGAFHRVIPLPPGVDGSRAKAKFKKGVLTVTAPKKPEEQSRRKTIDIESD